MRGSPPVSREEASPAAPPGATARAIPQGARIPALTGVRALAGFLVFFHHHPVFNLLAILLYEAIESPANRVLRRTVRPPVRAERAA